MSRLIKVNAPSREEYERNRMPFIPTCTPSRDDALEDSDCSKYPVGERTYVGRGRQELTVQQQIRRLPDSSYIEVSEDGVNWFVIQSSEARR